MKKYNVEVKVDNEKIVGDLQVKEDEIFIETDESIIQIPYSDIEKRSFTSKKGLELETNNYEFCINGKEIDEINDKVKLKLKKELTAEEISEETNIFTNKSDEEILTDIYEIFGEYLVNNRFLFLMAHKTYNDLAQETEEDEKIELLLYLSSCEFFFGLYKYILENIDKSAKTKEFFKNFFPDSIDEFNKMLEENNEKLVNYNYSEHLQNIIAWFAPFEKAKELGVDETTNLPKYEDFKTFMKNIEAAFNEYVKPSKKLNIFLNKKIEKKLEQKDDNLLQEVLKRFNDFNRNSSFIFVAGHEYHDVFNKALEEDDDEQITQIIKLVRNQFYLSLFIYVYNNIDNSEKTLEFFKNLYPELVSKEIVDEKDSLEKLGWDNYQKHLNNIIATCARMKKFRKEQEQKGEKIDEKAYKLYDDFEPYLLFLEEAYNNYVKPEQKLDIMLNHKSNDMEENKKAAFKYTFFGFYLPVILIVIMVFMFLVELFDEKGIIIGGGWFSVFIFIALIIWAAVGYDGKKLTCEYCGKFNSLKLTSDKIIQSRDTWKTKTEYVNNRSYKRQVAVRIDTHERHYKCDNCHNEVVRFENEEHEL